MNLKSNLTCNIHPDQCGMVAYKRLKTLENYKSSHQKNYRLQSLKPVSTTGIHCFDCEHFCVSDKWSLNDGRWSLMNVGLYP